jgi:hypothetical protein
MAAPALIALAHGSRDKRSAATVKALVDEVRAQRPDLRVEAAFIELSKPDFHTVVDRLVKAGHEEIVVVPLLLTQGIVLFQDTSLVYVLSLADFFRTASTIGERDGTQVEMVLFAGLVYFVISLSASLLVSYLKRKRTV